MSNNIIHPCVITRANISSIFAESDGDEYAVLTLPDGRSIKMRIFAPSYGDEIAIDGRALFIENKILFFDPGFNSTAACVSAITYINGSEGRCLYRGYDVLELVKKCSYLDVAYLLLNGRQGSPEQLADFTGCYKKNMLVHNRLAAFIKEFVPGAHPMSILASVLAAMASFYSDPMQPTHMSSSVEREEACIRILAKVPTICAMAYKILMGEPFVFPRSDLSYAENLLNMMFSNPTEPYKFNQLHVEVINKFLILHADHEQNASTSTVRTAGSSLANPYACIATGVTSLWGRAHGGANEAVIDMLQQIGSKTKVDEFIERVKRKECRLMGFGHRVYHNTDPRACIMKDLVYRVLEESEQTDPLFGVALTLEHRALTDDYFISRKLYPNVDFYSGLVMRALGIPDEMFTVLFATGRVAGWLAHWKEMVEENQIRISRPRQLYVGSEPRHYHIDEDDLQN